MLLEFPDCPSIGEAVSRIKSMVHNKKLIKCLWYFNEANTTCIRLRYNTLRMNPLMSTLTYKKNTLNHMKKIKSNISLQNDNFESSAPTKNTDNEKKTSNTFTIPQVRHTTSKTQ